MARFCDEWRAEDCDVKIDPPNIKVEGDFFIVTGTATNRWTVCSARAPSQEKGCPGGAR